VKGFESWGLHLWVESRPCVIYEKKGLVYGSPSFLCRGLWRNGGEKMCIKKEIVMKKGV